MSLSSLSYTYGGTLHTLIKMKYELGRHCENRETISGVAECCCRQDDDDCAHVRHLLLLNSEHTYQISHYFLSSQAATCSATDITEEPSN